ncbi:MAG: RNA polymerase sigma factor RpoD/SigA [Fibrobacterales bacterium]
MNFKSSDETIKRYLEDIRKTKPLSRQDEQALFKLCAKGSESARRKLISANMRFVLKVALQYRGCPIPLSDIVNEGSLGLIRAIESFDHSRGLKFISYAVWWIKAYITRAINENGNLIRLPANQHLKVRKALNETTNGKEISDEVRRLIQIGESGMSFDAPLSNDSKSTYADVLADDSATNPEATAELQSIEDMTKKMLEGLPSREAEVLGGLYGINQENPQTLRDVGEALNISHERVRQLRDQGLKRIRKLHTRSFLKEKFEGLLEAKNM